MIARERRRPARTGPIPIPTPTEDPLDWRGPALVAAAFVAGLLIVLTLVAVVVTVVTT